MIKVQDINTVGRIHPGSRDREFEFEVLYHNGHFYKFISDQYLLLSDVQNRLLELSNMNPPPLDAIGCPDDVRVEYYGDKS